MNLVTGRAYSFPTTEGFIMDAHFNEYLAAVAGMAEVYGAGNDDMHAISCASQGSEVSPSVDSGSVIVDILA